MIERRKQLKQFVKCGVFSDTFNDTEEILSRFEKLSNNRNVIKITYGETYDQYGLTIDSLKYYLILAILQDLLNKAESSLIIGDIASLRNIKDVKKEQIVKSQIKNNCSLIKEFIRKNELNINITLMSELFDNEDFNDNLKLVTKKYNESSAIRKRFEQIVLKNKLKQEYEKEFLYSREEIALIMDYQVKIGPPREQKYDNLANDINQDSCKLLGLYLKPTYPLGMNFDYFIQNEEIEKYGVTPYKAGSNRLQNRRLVIGEVDRESLKDLLKDTFVPKTSGLPDPLKDLFIILDLLKRYKEKDYDFPDYEMIEVNVEEILELINKYLQELYG